MRPVSIRGKFSALIKRADSEIDLGRGALLIAAEEDPAVDVEATLERLDELAEQIAAPVAAATTDFDRLQVLHQFLYEDLGLRGNREDYRDPENCLLHRVLERGVGIPLTLAIVELEVARRVDIPLEGINFPGHFLLRHVVHRQLLLDPFNGGQFLTTVECAELLDRMSDGQMAFSHDLLATATHLQILERLLNNLRTVYISRGEVERALSVLERLVLIHPEDLALRRDLGLLLLQYGNMAAGIEKIEHYLEETPEPPDRQKLEELLDQAKKNILPIQ